MTGAAIEARVVVLLAFNMLNIQRNATENTSQIK